MCFLYLGNFQFGFKASALLCFTGYSFLQGFQLCGDYVVDFPLFQKRKNEAEFYLFQISACKKTNKSPLIEHWKQYSVDCKLVFFYLCDESCECTGNISCIFGLPDYHNDTCLFYSAGQAYKIAMVISSFEFFGMCAFVL